MKRTASHHIALFSPLLLLLWFTPASTYAKAHAAPVKVTVYYETLCRDSKIFIVEQLYPVWHELQDIVEVDIKAYGKTQEVEPGKFECNHGGLECEANLMMTCAKMVISDFHVLMNFTRCVMDRFYGVPGGQACANETGVEFAKLQKCMASEEGVKMQQDIGKEQSTLEPTLYYVPWILIDGVFTREQLKEAEEDLRRVVCKAYKGPKPCPVNPMHPTSTPTITADIKDNDEEEEKKDGM